MTKRVLANKVSLAVDDLYYCDGQPFTGLAYTVFADGALRSESEYQAGLRWGTGKEWYKNGMLFAEAEFFRDVLHGVAREWSPTGQLVSEVIAEYGITVHERTWDEQGNLLAEYRLQEGDPDYAALLDSRRRYGAGRGR